MEKNIFTAVSEISTPHKFSVQELAQLVKSDSQLRQMDAYAKSEIAKAVDRAIESDEAQNEDNRTAENLARAAAHSSVAVLRVLGAMKN